MGAADALLGHFWTIAPSLLHRMRPREAPPSRAWSTVIAADAASAGRPVTLSGALCEYEGADSLVVVVHGLGGALESPYCLRAAGVLRAQGFSTLRLALRGADRLGEDFYHAGLVADLHAAIASPELAHYENLFVLGYSLGGHVSLHAGFGPRDPRVRALAAVCAPLDLERSSQAIDSASRFVYRQHVLTGLKDIYRAVAARHPVPTPLARIERVRTIREWDALTVVPRYGFADVADYYARMSAGFRLSEITLPTLFLPSRHDPMVPAWTYGDLLARASSHVEVRWVEQGGHVGYPAQLRVHGDHVSSIEEHVAGWFRALRAVRPSSTR